MIESIFSISPSDVLLALVATILIELGVLYLLGEKRKWVLLASVVINVATNVPLNLFSNHLHGIGEVLMAELLVAIVEALWYYLWVKDVRMSVCYGFLCNAISFLLGLLFFFLLLLFN